MHTIKIKALVAAYGLKRGDVADVEVTPSTDAMLDNGYWLWIDQPAAEPVHVTMTEAVKERKARAKEDPEWLDVVEDGTPDPALSVWEDEAPIDYTSFPDEN